MMRYRKTYYVDDTVQKHLSLLGGENNNIGGDLLMNQMMTFINQNASDVVDIKMVQVSRWDF